LKQGEFVAFADGKDKKLQLKLQNIEKEVPTKAHYFSQEDLRMNFQRIYREVRTIIVGRL
jgi:hypothetical protein